MIVMLLIACTGSGEDTSADTDTCACGDVDGPGGDTGDVPDVLGTWSSTWASAFYVDNCDVSGFGEGTEDWISSFYVMGTAPGDLYVYFGPQSAPVTDRLYGAMDPYGGITISGIYDHDAGTLHVQFGGQVYDDPGLGHPVIRGAGFLGLDVDDDGVIDCYANGSWTAIKSG